jgi:hypothetical protein
MGLGARSFLKAMARRVLLLETSMGVVYLMDVVTGSEPSVV